MTSVIREGDNVSADTDELEFGSGRGRFFRELPQTPARAVGFANLPQPPAKATGFAGSPALCSTRILRDTLSPSQDMTNPEIGDLITQIAQQIGQSISAQLQRDNKGREGRSTQAQSIGADQPLTDSPLLNLTGVKLVMQSDVKEPPCFRGDGSDKHSVHEWEELMEVYLRKRGVPVQEQSQEIISRLMGKAKDIIKITLRSNPSLKPNENPKVITDILKQHFSEMTYSSMPLADFYSTLPVAGENAMDYWIRLNKAVDVADEGLKRQGESIGDPSRAVTRMFVKHCPDPALAAVMKFKTADKWMASEIQEHLDEYQTEMKAQLLTRPRRSANVKHVTAHVQTSEDVMTSSCPVVPPVQTEVMVSSPAQADSCMQTLVSLLDRVLAQNKQTDRAQRSTHLKRCKVCKATNHTTLSHCRQEGLCLSCFEHGHWKRDCPKSEPRHNQQTTPTPPAAQPLN